MSEVERLRKYHEAEIERLDTMARDRDDVITRTGDHLRAALAVIDAYEAELHKLAFDEEH